MKSAVHTKEDVIQLLKPIFEKNGSRKAIEPVAELEHIFSTLCHSSVNVHHNECHFSLLSPC